MLICKLYLRKFIHEVTSTITFDCRDYYSDIEQTSTCKAGSAQERKIHVELARLHLQQFLFHKEFRMSASDSCQRTPAVLVIDKIFDSRRFHGDVIHSDQLIFNIPALANPTHLNGVQQYNQSRQHERDRVQQKRSRVG